MAETSKNVVDLSQYGQSRKNAGSRGDALLNECGEMAAARLAEALAKVMKRASQDLLKLAGNPASFEVTQLYMEAMELARDRGADIATAFRHQFYQRFRQTSRRNKAAHGKGTDLDISQLSLVEPDDLEESLAANNIANAIHNVCGEELFGLGHRVGILLHEHDLQSERNPIGPEVIGGAIMDALQQLDCGIKTRLMLVPSVNRHMPEQIKTVYQEMNRFLVEKGVMPNIRVGLRKSAGKSAETEGGEGPALPAAETANPDLFALLQQLMGMGRAGFAPMAGASLPGISLPGGSPLGQAPGLPTVALPAVAMPGMPVPGMALPAAALAGGVPGAPLGVAGGVAGASDLTSGGAAPVMAGPVMATPVVMQTLTMLQRGEVEGAGLPGMDPQLLGSGTVNVLREIRSSGVAQGMGQVDAMTLDIVAMVFDYILDDRRVPDAMKALIGRLQIPVLKVAMLDRGFFSQKGHPARRLLDVLADASMGWDEQEGHDSGLYRKVDDLVQRILNEFDEQMDVFAAALEELEQFLRDERQRADQLTALSAQVIRTREQSELASIVARDQIHGRLFGQSVPQTIRTFLNGSWHALLTRLHGSAGEDGEAWQQAVATMEDLIWSVIPKAAVEERRKLVAMLPGLLKRLDDGMRALDLPGEARDQFFTDLVKCHAEAVKAGLRGGMAETTVQGEAPVEPLPDPVEEMVAEAPLEFEDIPVLTETVQVDASLLEDIAAHSGGPGADTEEITISDVSWLAGGEPEGDSYDAMVKQLRRGTWIELQQDDGTSSRAKL
ncbi:MAG: DUF1631 domain-containing protein, partial [Thiobacillaceae bacterium]|nr:DUF1631 domain-containing protein [Thiobacillaceae bacterium]